MCLLKRKAQMKERGVLKIKENSNHHLLNNQELLTLKHLSSIIIKWEIMKESI